MTRYRLTSTRAVRATFWGTFPDGKPREFRGKSQNQLPADWRALWCDFVDALARDGTISERLARQVTL